MGFLKKLFGSTAPKPQPVNEPDEVELRGHGDFGVEVVGESHSLPVKNLSN